MEARRRSRSAAPRQRSRATSRKTKPLVAMIVDDHPMWRRTVRQVLARSGVAEVVAEASDGEEAVPCWIMSFQFCWIYAEVH